MLKQFGFQCKSIDALDANTLKGFALIVGPMAFDETMGEQANAVREFAAAGGRVVMLEHSTPIALPADTYVEPKGKFSTLFVREAAHPVMKGLKDVDLKMWNPGHLVAKGLYRVPVHGNFLPLVECYHFDGALAWTPLW